MGVVGRGARLRRAAVHVAVLLTGRTCGEASCSYVPPSQGVRRVVTKKIEIFPFVASAAASAYCMNVNTCGNGNGTLWLLYRADRPTQEKCHLCWPIGPMIKFAALSNTATTASTGVKMALGRAVQAKYSPSLRRWYI